MQAIAIFEYEACERDFFFVYNNLANGKDT